MKPSRRSTSLPLAAALLSGAVSYAAFCPPRSKGEAVPGASKEETPAAGAAVLPPGLRGSLSSRSTVEFLTAVRAASPAELRQAWLANP